MVITARTIGLRAGIMKFYGGKKVSLFFFARQPVVNHFCPLLSFFRRRKFSKAVVCLTENPRVFGSLFLFLPGMQCSQP